MLTGGDGRKRKWSLKSESHDRENESTEDNRCNREFSWRIVVILFGRKKRSLENACMAFCTWNKTLKGNFSSLSFKCILYWFKPFVCLFVFSLFVSLQGLICASEPWETKCFVRFAATLQAQLRQSAPRQANRANVSCRVSVFTISCSSLESSTEAQPKAIPL